jgi:hypothetical protein
MLASFKLHDTMNVVKLPAFLVTRTRVKVAYIASVTAMAAIAFVDPIWPIKWLFILTIVATLPAFVPALPVFYGVVGIAWNVSKADQGGPLWVMTTAYALMFCGGAIANVALVVYMLRRRQARRIRSVAHAEE